ncbi:MAG: MFS transporter [Nocardioidaceae bacterium]
MPAPDNARRSLAAVSAVLFLTFLDTTIVSVALSSVQSGLSAGVVQLQWVVNGYTLVFASLMLAAGSLGDRIGHRRVMMAGLAVFCVGSLVAAVATGVWMVILGRAVMGLGAAGSEPGTLAVIRHQFPDPRLRARAVGVWAAVSGLALALGPVIGGLLVGATSWRAVFVFNVVVSLALIAVVARWVPESRVTAVGRFDLPGTVLGVAFLGCLIFAAITGEQDGYDAAHVVTLFVLSGVALIAFVVVESRAVSPLLDGRYLRLPRVGSALLVAFAIYFGLFAIFFFTALYLQEVVGYSGWRTAAVFSPMAVAIIAGSLVTGRWVAGAGAQLPMILGCVIAAGGILLTRMNLSSHPGSLALMASLAIAGLGFGMAVVPLASAVLDEVPAAHAGMAAAATNTTRQLGAVIGVATLGGLVNANLTSGLTDRLDHLGIPANFQSIIIDAIESGQVPNGGDSGASAAYGPIVDKVIRATYSAFQSGLDVALALSAALILLAAVVSVVAEVIARRGHANQLVEER